MAFLLAGCSASVATSNPACIFMCQNSGDISTTKEKSNEVSIPRTTSTEL